jgi:sarcosine oxidase delta subunit
MSELSFIKSTKGEKMIVFQNYMFLKDKKRGNKSYYDCKWLPKNGCKARITLVDNKIVNTPKSRAISYAK